MARISNKYFHFLLSVVLILLFSLKITSYCFYLNKTGKTSYALEKNAQDETAKKVFCEDDDHATKSKAKCTHANDWMHSDFANAQLLESIRLEIQFKYYFIAEKSAPILSIETPPPDLI